MPIIILGIIFLLKKISSTLIIKHLHVFKTSFDSTLELT